MHSENNLESVKTAVKTVREAFQMVTALRGVEKPLEVTS
jgi:hypothetical protein